MNYRDILHKIFSALEARPVVGGMEISDSAIRFMASASSFAAGVKLPPGAMAEGRIQDEGLFLAALREIRRSILGRKAGGRAKVNVVVTLSSVKIYSQVFNLPSLESEEREKAVELNLKMASPSGTESYAGWEVLNERKDVDKIEVLSAFLEKSIADDIVRLLTQENFSVIAIEPKGVSIARILPYSPGMDQRSPVIVVSADQSGLGVMVIKNGKLHFDYYNSWADLQGGEKEMTLESFRALLTKSVNQVLNFYGSRWQEPIGDILVSASGMKEEILAALTANFSLKVREVASPVSPPITADWHVALGGAMRGRMPRKDDDEISLLGIDARDKFHEEQADHFFYFWRILAPSVMLLLIIIFAGSWTFLDSLEDALKAKPALKLSPTQVSEIESLNSKAATFNRQVALIENVNSSLSPKSTVLAKVLEITGRRGISLNRLTIGAKDLPVTLSGGAKSEEDIRSFKNELSITPGIKDVNLPITNIRKEGDNYSFSITFLVSS